MDMRECSVNSQSYNLLLLIADDLVKMLRITFADRNVVLAYFDFLAANRLHLAKRNYKRFVHPNEIGGRQFFLDRFHRHATNYREFLGS